MSKTINPIRAVYLDHINKQKESGLSLKKYCEQNNLKEHLFGYYRKYKLKPKSKPGPKAFSKVEVQRPEKINSINQSTTAVDPVWLAKFVNSLMGKI